jgi:hypothetical protein
MKPRVFIGSSTEGLAVANAVQQNMDHNADCTVWTQGVFGVSTYSVDALLKAVRNNDFSVFVFSPDDVTQIRNNQVVAARDNVILESGLFMGRYGKDRNFIVSPWGVPDFYVPSDLLGLTRAEYDPARLQVNAQAALGAACTSILSAINSHPVMTARLIFSVSFKKDGSHFPLKLAIEIRNTTTLSVLVTSKFFKLGSVLRAHTNAKGNPARRKYEIKFTAPGSSNLNQFTVLLHPNVSTSTWMPLDPSHTAQEVHTAIADARCGDWHYTCDWLGPDGWHREYVKTM